AAQGRRVGLASVAGVHLGTLVHLAAASAGLSAVIVASSVAFSAVKYAGAAYLVYLGVRKLLDRDAQTRVERTREPLRRAFVRGTIVNALNPKTALFFLAFLPQFVAPDRGRVWSQALVLGFVFVGLGLVTDSLYALAAGTVGGLLRRQRNAHALRLRLRLHRTRRNGRAREADVVPRQPGRAGPAAPAPQAPATC